RRFVWSRILDRAVPAHLFRARNVDRHRAARPARRGAVHDFPVHREAGAAVVLRLERGRSMSIETNEAQLEAKPRGAVALSVKHIKKVYQTDAGDIEAVRDLHFDIREGEFVCLVGPSGSGKTTLLKCIAGLMGPTSGS